MNEKKRIQKKYKKEIDIFNKTFENIVNPIRISYRVQGISKDIGSTLVVEEEKKFVFRSDMQAFLDDIFYNGFHVNDFYHRVKIKIINPIGIAVKVYGYDKDNDYLSYEWKFENTDISSFLYFVNHGIFYHKKTFIDKLKGL